MKPLSLLLSLLLCSVVLSAKPGPVFDMEEMRDASTLRVKVLQDWKKVGGPVPTRQKLISCPVPTTPRACNRHAPPVVPTSS